MSGNDFTIVGVATSAATIRSLDRGRVHQALFDVSTGDDTIACQMSRSDAKGLRRITDELAPGRMVVATGVLDTRVADVGALRVPILIPFVQHLELGDVLLASGAESLEPGPFRPPITFSRFRVEGMVTTDPRRCRVGRAHGSQIAVRSQHHTVAVLVLANTPDELARKTHGVVAGAEISAAGFLRIRSAGAGLAFLEAVTFSVRVTRGVVVTRVADVDETRAMVPIDRASGDSDVDSTQGLATVSLPEVFREQPGALV